MTYFQIRKEISQTILEDENKKKLSPFLWYDNNILLEPHDWVQMMNYDNDYLACDLPFTQLTANCLNRNIILIPILQDDINHYYYYLNKENLEENVTNVMPDSDKQKEDKMFLYIKANNPEIDQHPLVMLYFPDRQFGSDSYYQSIHRSQINDAILNQKTRNVFHIDDSNIEADNEEENSDDENDDYNTSKSRIGGNSFKHVTALTPNDPASSVIVNETDKPQTIKINRKKNARTFVIAPGEGKTPGDWLRDTDFDIEAFPHLFADGKYGLYYDKRPKQISPAKYFPQRILNQNNIFAKEPDYVFMAQMFLERYALEKQIDMSLLHGTMAKTDDGRDKMVPSDDKFAVFQSIPGTPAYWQKFRNEVYARISQLGPFHLFYTLSCNEARWPSVLAEVLKVLQKDKIKVIYPSVKWDGKAESIMVQQLDEQGLPMVITDGKTVMNLEEYHKWYLKTKKLSMTNFLKDHFILISRIFDKRVKDFHTEFLKKKGIRCYVYRVEFQMRGLPHIHGVAWLESEEIKDCLAEDGVFREDPEGEEFLINLINKWYQCSLYSEQEIQKIKIKINDLETNIQKYENDEKKLNEEKEDLLKQLKESKNLPAKTGNKKQYKTKIKTIEQQLKHLSDKLKNLRKDNTIKDMEEKVIKLRRNLDTDRIAKTVNMHRHTGSCKKYRGICRYNFPRLFSDKTRISNPLSNEILPEEKNSILQKRKFIIDQVKKGYSLLTEDDMQYDEDENQIARDELWRKFLTEKCELVPEFHAIYKTDDPLKMYYDAITISEKSRGIILKRKISERNVNNYNPLILSLWEANCDIQLCLDTYAIVSYISDYMTKSDKGLTQTLKEALNEKKNSSEFERLNHVKKKFFESRETCVCEAAYRLIPGLNLKGSDIKTIFLSSGYPQNRRSYFHQLMEEEERAGEGIEIEGRIGRFMQPISKFDYYNARPDDTNSNYTLGQIQNMCFAEFTTKYDKIKEDKIPKEKYAFENFNNESGEIVSGVSYEKNQVEISKNLPKYLFFTMNTTRYYMKLREQPYIARVFTGKRKDIIEDSYSELLLFTAWRNEQETFFNDHPNFKEFIREMFKKQDDDDNENSEGEFIQEMFKNQEEKEVDFINQKNIKNEFMKLGGKRKGDEVEENRRRVFPHSQRIEQLRKILAEYEFLNKEDILDPAGQQQNADEEENDNDNEDHFEDVIDEYPEYNSNRERKHRKSSLKEEKCMYKIPVLDDILEMKNKVKKFSYEQRVVFDRFIDFCKRIMCATRYDGNIDTTPPKIIVHGGGGVGKSYLIKVLSQWVHYILSSWGDISEYPKITKFAFTGSAAYLIGK